MSDEKNLEKTIDAAEKLNGNERSHMDREAVINESLKLVADCNIAMLGSNGENGFPNIKAMIKIETAGLKTIWFSTNTSTKRVSQFRNNPKACVYFVSPDSFRGLMLVGNIEVLSDLDSKKRTWREGCEVYYPLGVADPDYSVLRFTAEWGNYYHGLQNTSFEL